MQPNKPATSKFLSRFHSVKPPIKAFGQTVFLCLFVLIFRRFCVAHKALTSLGQLARILFSRGSHE